MSFKKITKYIIGTYFGISFFIESNFVKKFIEGWFRHLEWAVFTTAILGFGFKIMNNVVLCLGIISLSFLFIYTMLFWVDDAYEDFKESVIRTNEINIKFNLPTYSKFSTDLCFVVIILLLNLATFAAMYYGLVLFDNLTGLNTI